MKKNNNIRLDHSLLDIQDHVAFAANGNIICCFEAGMPEIFSQSEKDFDKLHSNWHQALKTLSPGIIFHKQDIYLRKTYRSNTLKSITFLEKATAEHFSGRTYYEHSCYLFFILPEKGHPKNSRYTNPFLAIPRSFKHIKNKAIEHFLAEVNDAVAYLNNSRFLKITPLKKNVIKQHFLEYYNGFEQDCKTDLTLDKTNLFIGSNLYGCAAINSERCFHGSVKSSVSNKKISTEKISFHQGFIDGLGLDFNKNHIVNQVIFLDDRNRWRKILEKRIDELKKSARFGSLNMVTQKKLEDILLRINEDENSRIIRGHLNIAFWDENLQDLKQSEAKIKTTFRDLDIVPYVPKGDNLKNYILNSYPAFISNLGSPDQYVTDLKHALCLVINNTNYQSDKEGILFNDRQYNLPVKKDVWDQSKIRIKAHNFAIFAPTGEGKSFLANNILRQMLEDQVRLVIIDLGGSYAKFAKLYPDDSLILRYESGKSMGINPFFLPNSDSLTPEKLEDLTVFLSELISSGTNLTRPQLVSIKKLLGAYYKHVEEGHSLQGFCDFIKHESNQIKDLDIHPDYLNIHSLLHILSEYIDDGLYSFLFKEEVDRSESLEQKRLIIFELDEVRDQKEILAVMLKLIKSAIQRTIWKNKEERGMILFDEFAKQLKFKNVLESVEFYYQAIRKQNGAIGIILQSINQLPDNASSASILDNTQVLYALHNEKGYASLVSRLNLSNHDSNQLHSLRNNLSGERKYTEIFIKIGNQSNVYRLEVPPEVYAAYLTDGPENQQIINHYIESGSMETAIMNFLRSKK